MTATTVSDIASASRRAARSASYNLGRVRSRKAEAASDASRAEDVDGVARIDATKSAAKVSRQMADLISSVEGRARQAAESAWDASEEALRAVSVEDARTYLGLALEASRAASDALDEANILAASAYESLKVAELIANA